MVDGLRQQRSQTQSVTNDNGQEFGRDDLIAKRLGVPLYFCTPSSPWQHGSVENCSGPVQQFVRQGAPFYLLSRELPAALEDTHKSPTS